VFFVNKIIIVGRRRGRWRGDREIEKENDTDKVANESTGKINRKEDYFNNNSDGFCNLICQKTLNHRGLWLENGRFSNRNTAIYC